MEFLVLLDGGTKCDCRLCKVISIFCVVGIFEFHNLVQQLDSRKEIQRIMPKIYSNCSFSLFQNVLKLEGAEVISKFQRISINFQNLTDSSTFFNS